MAIFNSCLALSIGLLTRLILANSDVAYPPGDVRNCLNAQAMDATKPLHLMEVLPGFGFDNLRNLDLGQVYNFSYASCQISADASLLLPDDIYLIPIQNSEVDVYSQVIEDFNQHTSETSDSVNVHAKVWHISGKFSYDFQKSKMHMVDTKSVSARAQARYTLYTVKIQPDAALSPHFVSRIMDLTAHIQNNNTKLAHYLADEIVRDYGTHAINSIDAGATISQTTMISKRAVDDHTLTTKQISASASLHFFVSISAKYQHNSSDKDVNNFINNTEYSYFSTHGGPPYQLGNFTIQDWEKGVTDYLVAVDRTGLPLHAVITSTNMPQLADYTRLDVENYLFRAIKRYYKINTKPGCLDPYSPNFNFIANVDDKSCKHPTMNFTFGGIYQTCEGYYDFCNKLSQKNPLTDDYSCPPSYVPILLHSGTESSQNCNRECSNFLHIHFHCHDVCTYPQATYSAFWCAHDPNTPVPQSSGYMFGGVYTSTLPNPVPKSSTCPMYFQALHFGEDMHVCVSDDERAMQYQIPFGGFFSCKNGNPLAASPNEFAKKSYPRSCPGTYSQVVATVDEDCLINYCITMDSLIDHRPQPPTMPPYRLKPMKNNNLTDTVLVVYGSNGHLFIKNENGVWNEYLDEGTDSYTNILSGLTRESVTPEHVISSNIVSGHTVVVVGTSTIPDASPKITTDSNEGTKGTIIAIVLGSVFGTLFVCSMIVLAVFGIQYARNKRSGQKKSDYLLINEQHDLVNYSSV